MNDSMNAVYEKLYILLDAFAVANMGYLLSFCTVVSVKWASSSIGF